MKEGVFSNHRGFPNDSGFLRHGRRLSEGEAGGEAERAVVDEAGLVGHL
jgi:hypothetical protein